MKHYYPIVIGILLAIIGTVTTVAFAGSILNVGLGGTGIGYPGISVGTLLIGDGTAPLATSSNLIFATSTGTLTATNASTTKFTISGSWWTQQISSLLLTDSNGKVGTASTQTCTNQFIRSITGGFSATCSTVQNTDLANSSITVNTTAISLGSSGTITAASSSALSDMNTWSKLQTFSNATSTLLTFTTGWATTLTITNASTTNLSVGSNPISGIVPIPVYMATSSWGTGTTTIQLETTPRAVTYQDVSCYTNAGTLNIQLGNGSASTTMLQASTTVNLNSYSSNNAFTKGSKVWLDIGTAASSPTKINCTFERNEQH